MTLLDAGHDDEPRVGVAGLAAEDRRRDARCPRARPLVQEPIITWWTFVPATSLPVLTLSTVCGQATSGSSFALSTSSV